MSHSGIFSVFLLVLVFDYGFCIECYSCSSKTNEACIRPDKSTVKTKQCGMTELTDAKLYAESVDSAFSKLFHVDVSSHDSQVSMNCLKQVTKVGNKEYIIRGCQLAPSDQLDICVKVKEQNQDALQTTHCSLCNYDGCNSALMTATPMPFLFLFVALIAVLIQQS